MANLSVNHIVRHNRFTGNDNADRLVILKDCLSVISSDNITPQKIQMSNDVSKVNNTIANDSSQVILNTFLKVFHQNIKRIEK